MPTVRSSRFGLIYCFGLPKQNVSTFEISYPIIALGSSGTLTCKFSPNFRLLISPTIQGVSKNYIGYNQLNTPSTDYTQQHKNTSISPWKNKDVEATAFQQHNIL